jgi:hypothetical protein
VESVVPESEATLDIHLKTGEGQAAFSLKSPPGPTVAIHQPIYFPWLGYFYKIPSADVFVFLDDAQFVKNHLVNRNLILSSLASSG